MNLLVFARSPKKFLPRTESQVWLFRSLALVLALSFAGWLIADEKRPAADLTVHEWGTFTAIAGNDGHAMEWTPFTGATDLPGFVEHVGGPNFKVGLRGTIRMETPVMYFYSPRDVTASVRVAFSKGVITEWYPRANRVQPGGQLRSPDLSQLKQDGSIAWNGIAISRNLSGEFPREDSANRYYAARETSSAPLRVNTTSGEQQEKFLFYRGVSAAPLPISAVQSADSKLLVRSLSQDKIPAVFLFERRGERVGYRLTDSVTGETVLEAPELNGSVDTLSRELEGILVGEGLYADEAHAMVETWRDSWFEEGSRLIYVVPRGFVDRVLPLTTDPVPGQMVRVFVGRLEIVTPATVSAVQKAVASNDEATLNKYSRFLEAILQIAEGAQAEIVGEHRSSR